MAQEEKQKTAFLIFRFQFLNIKILIPDCSQHNLEIEQSDVKTTYFKRVLKSEVYVNKSPCIWFGCSNKYLISSLLIFDIEAIYSFFFMCLFWKINNIHVCLPKLIIKK